MTAANPIPASAGIPVRAGSPEACAFAGYCMDVSSQNSAASARVGAAIFGGGAA